MCWSAPVSLGFGALDLAAVAILFRRRRGRDVTYAALLCSIAVQEWTQFAIWSTDAALYPGEEECLPWKAALSFLAFAAAASIPLVLVWRSKVERPYDDDEAATYRKYVLAIWSFAVILDLTCCYATGNYCVRVGRHHHQVWICGRSLYDAGGYPLYFFGLLLYFVSGLYGFFSLKLPAEESTWVSRISVVTCGTIYAVYSWTLEACSIWCWSAFMFGVYAVLRPLKD